MNLIYLYIIFIIIIIKKDITEYKRLKKIYFSYQKLIYNIYYY